MRAKLNEWMDGRTNERTSNILNITNTDRAISTGPRSLFQWKHTFEFEVFYLNWNRNWNAVWLKWMWRAFDATKWTSLKATILMWTHTPFQKEFNSNKTFSCRLVQLTDIDEGAQACGHILRFSIENWEHSHPIHPQMPFRYAMIFKCCSVLTKLSFRFDWKLLD